MDKKIVSTAAFIGMITIILGAFGAHALKKLLLPEQLITFETGVKYQMYHALFLLFIGTTNLIDNHTKKCDTTISSEWHSLNSMKLN